MVIFGIKKLVILLVGLGSFGFYAIAQPVKLLHVSYDPTRELFKDYNMLFLEHNKKSLNDIQIMQSHGGSGKQARAVIDGLRAHVVSLALEYDVMVIAKHGYIKSGWYGGSSTNPSPFYSTIVFLVRKGNPKGIRDWDDIVKPDVAVITPNPKTSGGARWNFLAAWGFVTVYKKESEKIAESFIRRLFKNVPVLDTGARGATTTFVQRGIGDVYLCWENEAMLALKEYGTNRIEIIYPSVSILAEPCLAVVDKNVDRNGIQTRKVAEEYIKFMFTPEGQELIAKHHFRPFNKDILQKYSSKFPDIKLFTIKDVAGDWQKAHEKFFGEDGIFDKIHRP